MILYRFSSKDRKLVRLDKVIESLLVNCFQKACFLKKFQFPNRVVDVLRLQLV
jgi:hypothetical protein